MKRPIRTLLLLPIIVALSLGLGACGFVGFPGVYRIDIEQGNLVDQEMIEQLKPAMSRRQVRFIMGSPLAEDPFNPDRWDYPYVIRNGQTIIREAQVTLYFENDTLARIEGDYLPEWARGEEAGDDGLSAPDNVDENGAESGENNDQNNDENAEDDTQGDDA